VGAHESRYAWIASLPKTFPNALRFLYKVSNGDADAFSAKDMLLTEDGRRLPHAGALHDEIRKSGLGRYSHWGSWLYFAASDNSNPNTNGRKYILRTTTSAETK
jgi:pectate lyase